MKEIIKTRQSQRSYNGQSLSIGDEKKLVDYLEQKDLLTGVFGHRIKVHYIKTNSKDLQKISTYGVVKNAPSYLVTVCENTPEALVDCGYVLEKLMLYLKSIGISTCWLGGTFKRSQLEVPVEEGQFIPIISPVGYAAVRKSFSDKTVRRIAGSDKRRPYEELFFQNTFSMPVTDSQLLERLSYVRMGPSASNKQPWRIVMDENDTAHLFLERTPNYGYEKLGYDIQMVDMGIAMCHYEIAKGAVEFTRQELDIPMLSEYTDYVVSMD